MKKTATLLSLTVAMLAAQPTAAQVITTFAGSTISSYSGDGGQATAALLNQPAGVATDASGNIYFSDQYNNRVRKISTSGIITTVAGSSYAGFSGDGGPATNAMLYFPAGICLDPSGNLYVADLGSNRLRKIDTAGIITTIAGNGCVGFSGDGGQATAACYNQISNVLADASGNIYLSDRSNRRVRKINASGIVTTVAGNGSGSYSGDGMAATAAGLPGPDGLALDASGNLYIADEFANRVRKVNTSGVISTFAGSGTMGFSGDGSGAILADMHQPRGISFDASGNLYIVDMSNTRIRKVSTSGVINTIAGSSIGFSGDGSAATLGQLNMPQGVTVDASGNVYISDQSNNRIRKVNTSGIISTYAGSGGVSFGDGGPATNATLSRPTGMVSDTAGNIYFCDEAHHKIRKVSPTGVITTICGNGLPSFSGDGGPATAASVNSPAQIIFDRKGNMIIADCGNARLRKIDARGIITTFAGNGSAIWAGDGGVATSASIAGPFSIAADNYNNIYAWDQTARVRKIDTNGIISTYAGRDITTSLGDGDGGPATSASFYNVNRGFICSDNANNIYVSNMSKIRKIDSNGYISTFAGTDSLSYSGDGGPATAAEFKWLSLLHIDNYGNLLVADGGNYRVRSIDWIGTVTTIAGTGISSYYGDGGSPTAAGFSFPMDVIMDRNGIVYIADYAANVIRKIAGLATLAAPLAQQQDAATVTMYPNPVNNALTIFSDQPLKEVMMYDVSGKLIYQSVNNLNLVKIDLSAQPAGLYIVVVNNTVIRKVIKE